MPKSSSVNEWPIAGLTHRRWDDRDGEAVQDVTLRYRGGKGLRHWAGHNEHDVSRSGSGERLFSPGIRFIGPLNFSARCNIVVICDHFFSRSPDVHVQP